MWCEKIMVYSWYRGKKAKTKQKHNNKKTTHKAMMIPQLEYYKQNWLQKLKRGELTWLTGVKKYY